MHTALQQRGAKTSIQFENIKYSVLKLKGIVKALECSMSKLEQVWKKLMELLQLGFKGAEEHLEVMKLERWDLSRAQVYEEHLEVMKFVRWDLSRPQVYKEHLKTLDTMKKIIEREKNAHQKMYGFFNPILEREKQKYPALVEKLNQELEFRQQFQKMIEQALEGTGKKLRDLREQVHPCSQNQP